MPRVSGSTMTPMAGATIGQHTFASRIVWTDRIGNSGSAMHLLRVGIVSTTFYYTPLWSAIESGLFRNVGLDVELRLIGHQRQVELLRSMACDITIAPPDGILQDVDSGGCARIVAGNADRLSHRLITKPSIASMIRAATALPLTTTASFARFLPRRPAK